MSDSQDKSSLSAKSSATNSMQNKIRICLFSAQVKLTPSIARLLNCDRYQVETFSLEKDAVDFLIENEKKIECIVLLRDAKSETLFKQLWQSKILLPAVIIETANPTAAVPTVAKATKNGVLTDIKDPIRAAVKAETIYHRAEILLYLSQLAEIDAYINLAITKFLGLADSQNIDIQGAVKQPDQGGKTRSSLVGQQQRIAAKIEKKLGYSRIYCKRQPSNFHRNLAPDQQTQLYQELGQVYRKILLQYFDPDSLVNKLIDEFVDQAFFADISTSQILEMHMEMIDAFSYQLKIEGRNDDILLDYRLPLIDVVSHLCELYRRSILGADIADIGLDLMFSAK